MNKLLSLTAACSMFAAPAAFAINAQTHHCMVNGAEVSKTKKQCQAAKGTWAKGAPSTAASPTAAPQNGQPRSNTRDPAVNPGAAGQHPADAKQQQQGRAASGRPHSRQLVR